MDGETELTSKSEIREHIVEYYKTLFRDVPTANIHLSQGVWANHLNLSDASKENLTRPFVMAELNLTQLLALMVLVSLSIELFGPK